MAFKLTAVNMYISRKNVIVRLTNSTGTLFRQELRVVGLDPGRTLMIVLCANVAEISGYRAIRRTDICTQGLYRVRGRKIGRC